MPEDALIAENGTSESATRTSRLEPIPERSLLPWRKAQNLEHCHLYWMPTGAASIPFAQRQWLLRFTKQLRAKVISETGTLAHLFLQMKVVYPDLADTFIRNAARFAPVTGLSRRRGAALPALPDAEYIERLKNGKQTYDHKALQPDYAYWFLKDELEEQCELFFGYGGLTTLFTRSPDAEATQLPSVPAGVARQPAFASLLADNAMEKMRRSLARLSSPFFAQSKVVFGRGLEHELQFAGLKFIVPLFSAQDFLQAGPAEIEEWFTMFDVVLTESPVDKGVLLASRHGVDLDEMLIDILGEMDQVGDKYPEYA